MSSPRPFWLPAGLDDVPLGGEGRLWLYGTARHMLANQRRGKGRRGRLGQRLREELRRQVPAQPGHEQGGVLEALAAIGEADRELLMLIGWEELTPSQAARVLGISPLAARSRLHRAWRRLRADSPRRGREVRKSRDGSRGGTMKTKKIDLELRAANPFALRRLTGLDLGAAEAALGAALVAESLLPGGPEVADAASRRHSWRPRRVLLALAGAMAVGVAVTIVLLSGGGATESPTRAYGAELVRFAQSTPLLLLQGRAGASSTSKRKQR